MFLFRRADVWDHNGPVLLTRAFKKWCEKNIKEKEDHVECKGFRAYAPSLFYPVDFEELDLLFSNNVKQRNYFGSEVTGVHTWNKLSYKRTVFKHSHQLYNSLARENCPVTFQHSPMMF